MATDRSWVDGIESGPPLGATDRMKSIWDHLETTMGPRLDLDPKYVSEGGLEPPCPVKGTSTSS